MDEEKWLCGLKYARSLNFTDAQYEEALKVIDSPDNANQLLVALIDVSSRGGTICCNIRGNRVVDKREEFITTNSSNTIHDRESSTSCYSSITSFPSSSDQSLECIPQQPLTLRNICIDGSNVARTHGKNSFSWPGIRLCFEWFYTRQHSVKVLVPADKCYPEKLSQADETIVNYLHEVDALIETPIGCNDDFFIIKAAKEYNGVIVSNDQYREEIIGLDKGSNKEFQEFISHNRLPYVFVDDLFIPAYDPRGRTGPTLDRFLRDPPETSNHSKLYRTKSHQRNGFPQKQHNNINKRSLQSTRSLPIEQTRSIIIDDSNQSINRSQYYQQSNQNHQQRQQVRKAVSVAYTNSNTKESDIQLFVGRKPALGRTKSHNF